MLCRDYYLPDLALPEEKYYELVRYDRAKFRYCYEMLHGYLNADWCGILDVDMEIGRLDTDLVV